MNQVEFLTKHSRMTALQSAVYLWNNTSTCGTNTTSYVVLVARITVLHLSNINVIPQLEQIFCQIQNFNLQTNHWSHPRYCWIWMGFKWKCSIFLTLAAHKCPCAPVCGIIGDHYTATLWHLPSNRSFNGCNTVCTLQVSNTLLYIFLFTRINV